MIGNYGLSFAGKSHLEKRVPCQDAHGLCELGLDLFFAAVADGVGSAACSEAGAAKAVQCLKEYVESNIHEAQTWEARKGLLYTGFHEAMNAIATMAKEENRRLSDYDTTLTAVIFDGNDFVYGHSGDGGMIKRNKDGTYQAVTTPQKGEAYNEVCPLRSGSDIWEMGQGADCCGLLLFTDGVLDVAQPTLLKNTKEPLYTRFLNRFLPDEIFTKDDQQIASIFTQIQLFLQQDCGSVITDDITAVAVWNRLQPPKQPDLDYFSEPDWELLKKERYYRLYPHLRPKEEIHALV